ncbi:Putative aliphatic sulfonates transport permease protein SsuC [Variovorax sp. SRS16]|uniref:ABC transporter permease n=1 Tax=Variovorax sp. SRS16 TaxID=282217 RepID=UPI001318F954|nr:ABC transporter permease [Variovorax sp. SRS16]VTU19918.1 Putative aliphatic sulfonates transport permease protein SsuC [Variovorax sp. SRS16]
MSATALHPVPSTAPAADPEYAAWAVQRRRRLWRSRILPALGIVGLILGWWAIVVWFGVKPFVAPSPWVVVDTLWTKRDVLLSNLIPTAIEAGGGFLLGNLAAILIATVFVHNKTLQEIFFPVVLMFNAIPVVAKAPILVLIMGNDMEPKITIAALVCFFPTLVNTVRGLESVNPQAMELMRVLSASKTEIFFRLRLFNALPFLFSALRIAASMAVIGAVVGEWVGANVGVGAMIIQATFNFDSALLYAAILMSASLSGFFFLLVVLAERWIIRWQPEDAH